MLSKHWLVADSAPQAHLKKYKGISPILAQVLYNRGLADPNDAYVFLTAEGGDSFDPFKMSDMPAAVQRVKTAIRKQELIIVYGDFDADGATSTALLMTVLTCLGAKVQPYIPHRVDEGYGLNLGALRKIYSMGAELIITVDCGIRSVEEVHAWQKLGKRDIIVTDHHSIGPELPPAFAVVNPKRDKAPVETMLAGVGVAFKFAQAIVRACNTEGKRSPLRAAAQNINVEDLLDLVAIGTVADLVPLDKIENRLLVRRGLNVLNQAKRPGVRALMEVAGIAPGQVDAMSIGFGLGPRINAAGRLESAMLSYELLYTNDTARAQSLAARLQELNEKRQDLTREAQEIVRVDLEERDEEDAPLIFASHEGFQHGIVGLVAGRLTEEYYRPAVVMRVGDEESNASCRSIPQFDITQALDQCADLLVRHGGHAQAAGFTVLNDNIDALRDRLTGIATDSLHGQELRPTIEIDADLDIHQLNEDIVEEMKILQPTGNDNPAPLFMTSNAFITEWKPVGRDERHLKLKLSRAGQPPLDAIGFNLGEWAGRLPERVDVAYELEINEWNGRRNLQLNLKDIRPAGVNGK
ncbi:MAG: single-stranded-DNA-specific exonuclease RecJ [Chloroflexota bacterium]